MIVERTLSIIKPDAVTNRHIGEILARFEKTGLTVVALKMLTVSRQQIEQIYGIHEGRPYYPDLFQFMGSGPSVAVVLEGENAIEKNRAIMGHTNPALAAPGTIRADFGTATNRNAVHGSDGPRTARAEIASLFGPEESQLYSADGEQRYQSART
ncbi:MAG: nucleoside-diphosphate kinase [Gammaproteobacteria bacterium]